MIAEKVLVLNLWGDWGHFRRVYTTTSSLTYPFPPRTTIIGLLAAIMGFPRDSYYEYFSPEKSLLALEILGPIRTKQINFNLIRTKEGYLLRDIKAEGKRSQIPIEFIKKPRYRLYIGLADQELYSQLHSLLRTHKSIFTPCFGISELIANYQFEGEMKVSEEKKVAKGEEVTIHTIIKKAEQLSIKVESDRKYARVKVPAVINAERIVSCFQEFYYEQNGLPLKISRGPYYSIGKKNVLFF